MSVNVYKLKQGSNWPPLTATFGINKAGGLTGATVTVYIKDTNDLMVWSGVATIVNAIACTISIQLNPSQTAIMDGVYWLEMFADWGDGNVAALPTDGFYEIHITKRIT